MLSNVEFEYFSRRKKNYLPCTSVNRYRTSTGSMSFTSFLFIIFGGIENLYEIKLRF